MRYGAQSSGSGRTDMSEVSKARVAVVAAMEMEVRPLVRSWRVCEREHGGKKFRFFEETQAVVVCGGIGAEAARRAAEAVIALYSPDVIYSVGFAGALDPALKIGDVVQPAQVINAGDGSRVSLGKGDGILLSFSSVASPEQKTKLRKSFGAHLVDMEAASVARAAQAGGVEFAAVKAISDEWDFAFPEIERFVDAGGQFQQARFAAYAALRPWLWPKVNQLASNSKRASDALCDRLMQLLNHAAALTGR
jgi:adenosylhomocysteine nucleosidase